jgi:hypothetical protein
VRCCVFRYVNVVVVGMVRMWRGGVGKSGKDDVGWSV